MNVVPFDRLSMYLLCPHRAGALSDDARLTSVCRIHWAPPKSRTERPRKTKIGTEVAHVTRDSDTTLKVKSQLAEGGGILWRPPAQLVNSVCGKRRMRALVHLVALWALN